MPQELPQRESMGGCICPSNTTGRLTMIMKTIPGHDDDNFGESSDRDDSPTPTADLKVKQIKNSAKAVKRKYRIDLAETSRPSSILIGSVRPRESVLN